MPTLIVKVCEECRSQSASGDGWLVISSMDIRSAKTGAGLVQAEKDLDFCSPGCLLRYISSYLVSALNRPAVEMRGVPPDLSAPAQMKVA